MKEWYCTHDTRAGWEKERKGTYSGQTSSWELKMKGEMKDNRRVKS
jgi:hypothetical protein